MKKYFSSLLVLTLFLSNFSVFAMRNKKIEIAQKNNKIKKFNELPDDVIFYVLVPFLDGKTLANMRFANKDYKKKLDEFIIFIYLKDFKKGFIAKQLAYNVLNFAGIRHLKNELQDKIQKHGSTKLCINNSNFKFLDSNNLGQELYNEFSYKSKLLQIPYLMQHHLQDLLLSLGIYYTSKYIWEKIGLKKPNWIWIEVFSTTQNSNLTRKITSKIANFAIASMINFGVAAGARFLCDKIRAQDFTNNHKIKDIISITQINTLYDMIQSGIQGAIKNGPVGAASGMIKGASHGILIGGILGVQGISTYTWGINLSSSFKHGIRMRHTNDMTRLQNISGVENRN